MAGSKDAPITTVIEASNLSEEHKLKATPPASSWTVLVQGVALFSDGYNVQIIGYMESVLKKLYPNELTSSVKTRLSNSILIGEVLGMLLFGLCIDHYGRRVGIVATTIFLVFGIVLAMASQGTTVTGMFWMMIISRGIASIGASGEYAVCTAQAVESADANATLQKKRGFLVAVSTNLAIVTGFTASSIVSIVVIAAYGGVASDGIWRICFGIGIKLALKKYWRPLFGCCFAWFLYDFVVYPFNLLAPTLVSGFGGNQTLLQSVGWSALINAFAIPGAFLGAFMTDWIGRRQTYVVGWSVVSVMGFIIFLSVGPGDCNFLVSSESFPTPLRGHFLGFATAVGKAGSAIGTTVLTIALNSFEDEVKGQQTLFLIGSSISALGTAVVWFFIPDHPKSLEDEDQKFRAYLEENGFDTREMGIAASD